MSRRSSDLLFALLVLLALALTAISGLVLSGRLVSDPSHSDRSASPPPPPPPAKTRPPQARTQPAATTPPTRKVPQTTSVRVAASRGDCWVVAHAGSAEGPVLIERVLRSGEQVTLRGRRIWLELGAAGNVDVTLNGKQRQIPSGTTNLLLG